MTSAALPIPATSAGAKKAEIAIALVVVFVIALIVVPLPPVLLDLCLAASIGLSLVVLLVSLYTTNPLDFSSFPALLLLLTLFRMGLNVSSTRLILTQAHAARSSRHSDSCHRRQLCRRYRHLPDPHRHQFHRHHQGCRPHRGSRGALHPRCHARQADGDRRRSVRRSDRRKGSPHAPR